MINWRSVEDKLPDLGLIVLIHYNGIVTFGARCENDEGWCWAKVYDGNVSLAYINDDICHNMESDDDYPVSHWALISAPGV